MDQKNKTNQNKRMTNKLNMEKYLQCVKGEVREGINDRGDIKEEKIRGFKDTKMEIT